MQPPDQRFLVERFAPAYLAPGRVAELRARAQRAVAALRACTSCPRACGVDRRSGQAGVCRIGRWARVSSAFPHFGEEHCLRGTGGSGTIFLSGCNLHCVFCQNADISQAATGREYEAQSLAEMMLALQAAGCHNVNLVTPEHVVPQLLEALVLAVGQGLRVPIVYNTSAYDSLESLRLLDGVVDIYMPDFKLWSETAGARYLGVRDYGARARAAISEMHRQVGALRFTAEGLACRGVLVRHLVLPGLTEESAAIFRWLAQELTKDTYVNIMGQYWPGHRVTRVQYPDINRVVTPREMSAVRRLAGAVGLRRCD